MILASFNDMHSVFRRSLISLSNANTVNFTHQACLSELTHPQTIPSGPIQNKQYPVNNGHKQWNKQ